MRRLLALLIVPFFAAAVCSGLEPLRAKVGYATFTPQLTGEDSAAVAWLARHPLFAVAIAPLHGVAPTVPECDILWVHLPDSAAYRNSQAGPGRKVLATYVAKGGTLLCTDFAAYLPNDLGFERVRPTVRYDTLKDDWLWDKKGFQSHLGHPILAGLFGGDYVWDAREDQVLPIIGYYDAAWPAQSKVLAVEKSYVFMHAERKTVLELHLQKSRMISIGGLIYFARQNTMRRTMEKFIENTLLYLAGRHTEGPVTTWEPCDGVPRPLVVRSRPLRFSGERMLRHLSASGLMLPREHPENQFFDLAGRRTLVMGHEDGGIDEVWVHPIRAMRDYQAGIVSEDSVVWLQNLPVAVEVRPESFTRIYTVPDGRLTEVIYPSINRGGGIIHYETTTPVRLMIRLRADLRLMWPYDASALGNAYFGYDEPMRALHVRDSSGTFACIFGADVAPRAYLAGPYETVLRGPEGLSGKPTEANQVAFGAEYDLGPKTQGVINFCFAGTNEGSRIALEDYRALLEHPEKAHRDLVRHYRTLLSRSLSISSPDAEFNRLWSWAIVGADRFVTRTPGLGTGLVAGFSTVARGWDGAQKISGRPGYAWYFGRDAAWASFALDGYGDFETVRKQLELYQRFQDISGKIYHELMTSGVVHYDASDATPLYIILMGHYLRASGDSAFVRKSWPSLKRALDFLYSTDTDRDGLIENTDVGHGWMEPGGSLFGVHSEMHLTVLWSQALREAASMAQLLGKQGLGTKYNTDAETVRVVLNRDFWNPQTQFFNYGKLKDGTFRQEPTALAAAGALYGLLDDAKAQPMLERLAGNGFSTNWGVRVVSGTSSIFNPRSYQEGSVWPLMTGWTALGEYTYGNSAQGFTHMMNVMRIKNLWALGFVQEVMHGALNRPAGVCPHQCWSETSILHPAIEGMVGWKPDAPHRLAALRPRFPLHWDSVSVSNLRIGSTVLQCTMHRARRTTVYTVRRLEGPSCLVHLSPEIPPSMEVTAVKVNGVQAEYDRGTFRGILRTPIQVMVKGTATVVLEHTGGIGMVPVVPRPVADDSAMGTRIVSTELDDAMYTIVVEGKQGEEVVFPIFLFDHALPSVQGGRIRAGLRQSFAELVVAFDRAATTVQRKTVRLQLR
jgi:glycogen debranching enzyme